MSNHLAELSIIQYPVVVRCGSFNLHETFFIQNGQKIVTVSDNDLMLLNFNGFSEPQQNCIHVN